MEIEFHVGNEITKKGHDIVTDLTKNNIYTVKGV